MKCCIFTCKSVSFLRIILPLFLVHDDVVGEKRGAKPKDVCSKFLLKGNSSLITVNPSG